MTDTTARIAELEAELKVLRHREEAEKNARRDSVKPVFQFTLMPTDSARADQLLDVDNFWYYKLHGEVVNRDELIEVGAPEHTYQGGGMVYLFCTLNGRFVTRTGGGRLWLSKNFKEDEDAWLELSAFITQHPDGGDVTEIVNKYRNS